VTDDNFTTNTAGIPAASDEHSLTVGPDGPILLQDHYLIEQMAQFNRERVPERQPHAKGGGAFGRFEVTNGVSAYTKADLFQPGRTIELLVRFSRWPVSAAVPTPGVTLAVSPSSSTRRRGTTTWSATTRRSSSCGTR
jgi:catalase